MNINTCRHCNKNYSNVGNLRKHVKHAHSEAGDYLAALQLRKNKHYAFTCDICQKRFTYKKHLTYHTKTHGDHSSGESTTNTKSNHQCAMCDNFCSDKMTIIEHYKQFHSIPIEHKLLMFKTEQEFLSWKLTLEDNTNSKFITEYRQSYKTHISTYFVCHRSGRYTPKGKNIRQLKVQGSNKINALCPASIKLKKRNNGVCEVIMIDTHVGHENDIGRLNLSKIERDSLASKIASKVPFEDILDDIKNSITNSELKRLHLLTKKDLYNIESCFDLCSSSVRHKSDVVNVESWINEMRNKGDAILFYKPQGCQDEEWPALGTEDFVLIIMTAAQREMLRIYGTNCICIDGAGALGVNNYDFELITLLVVDDTQEAVPCSFLVSNRSDTEVLKIFFYFVKTQLGTALSSNVFMSDMADKFYNAWLETMFPPKLRLYSTWHVDQAWRKNLSKINTKDKQAFVNKNLRTVLEERDVTTFNFTINKLCTMLLEDPDTVEFANYFSSCYMSCAQCWAYCHRLGTDINTNVHLERMHKTLKYIYSKGKKVERLDKAINAIMRFARDICIDRLTTINKGKLSSTTFNEDNLVIIKEESHESQSEEYLTQLSSNCKSESFNANKQRVFCLYEELQHELHNVTTDGELEVIEKALVSMKNSLTALKHAKRIEPKSNQNEPYT